MNKWEYKTLLKPFPPHEESEDYLSLSIQEEITMTGEEDIQHIWRKRFLEAGNLNYAGEEGWELVNTNVIAKGLLGDDAFVLYTLKRQL